MTRRLYEIERVEFLFWPVGAEQPSGMFKVGESELRWSMVCRDEDEFIRSFMEAMLGEVTATFMDDWLRPALRRVAARKFIPLSGRSNPSIEYRPGDKTFELCAHHDVRLHDIIFQPLSGTGLVMAPIGSLEDKLEAQYARYGVAGGDERLFAEAQ